MGSYYYKGANHTVDILLVSPDRNILLIRRGSNAQACANMLAFPGGFVDTESKKGQEWVQGSETHDQAALRELKEETGLEIKNPENLQFIGVYEGNGRDPRDNQESWSRSQAYLYKLTEEEYNFLKGKEKGMDDASDAAWYSIDNLNEKLAFDHNEILKDAMLVFEKNITKKLKR